MLSLDSGLAAPGISWTCSATSDSPVSKQGDAPLGRATPAKQASPQRRRRNRHGEHPQTERRTHQTDQTHPSKGAGDEASQSQEYTERHTSRYTDRMRLGGHAVEIRPPQDRLQHAQALFPQWRLGQDPGRLGKPRPRDASRDGRLERREGSPHLNEHGRRSGHRAGHRKKQRRPHHQDAHAFRLEGKTHRLPPHWRQCQRLRGLQGTDQGHAGRRVSRRRPRLRRKLDPERSGGDGNPVMHSRAPQSKGGGRLRRRPVQDAAQDRKRLRQVQGLQTHRTARPQMSKDLSWSGPLCGHRQILVVRGFNES